MGGAGVQRWRHATKRKMIEAFGGKCALCGYDKCDKAFDFHHLDPNSKDFAIATVTMAPIAIEKIAAELEKCTMLCANCHREVHAGLHATKLVSNFDKSTFLFKTIKATTHPCAVCGKDTGLQNITCSIVCSAKRTRKVKWDDVDLKSLLATHKIVQIARILNVSDSAVRKRANKLGLL